MIEAKDLRIGNLVRNHERFNEDTFEVVGIDERIVVLRAVSGEAKSYSVELNISTLKSGAFRSLIPIPLTEEWLLKFGFTDARNCSHKKYNEAGNIFQLNKVDGKFEFTWGGIPVETVHHLQNLYHALVMEELKTTNAKTDLTTNPLSNG